MRGTSHAVAGSQGVEAAVSRVERETPGGSDGRGGTTSAPVSRRDVHKRNADHVWLGMAETVSKGVLAASYSVPPFPETLRLVDLMEVQRQAGIVHVHRHLAVPHDEVFALQSIGLSLVRPCLLSLPETRCGIVRVQAKGEEEPSPSGRIRSASHLFEVAARSGLEAYGTSNARFISKVVYERFRRSASSRLKAEQMPKRGQDGHRERLVIDKMDPILSDHDSDHIPAMAIACAVEKSVTSPGGRPHLAELSICFHSYVDPLPAPTLVTRLRDGSSFSGIVEQEGVARASFTGRAFLGACKTGGS